MMEPRVPSPDVLASRPPGRPLVFLSTLSAVDAFVLRSLCAVHPDVHLIRLVDEVDPKRPPLRRRVLAHPWRSVTGGLRDLVQVPSRHRMEKRIQRALFDGAGVQDPKSFGVRAVTEVPVWQVRSPLLRRQIEAIAPGRLLVCGAPWLPASLYTAAEHCSFNVHWGIAPEYRGGYSIFWALAEGRFDRIGVTIHELTPRIDAGDIVAQGTVSVDARDDETSLWVKCAHEAATLVASLASLPAEVPLDARPQGAGGHNYHYAERTLGQELRCAVRRHLLHRRPTPAPGVRQPARPRTLCA